MGVFVFLVFFIINYLIYDISGIPGLLILNFAIITSLLYLFYDKWNSKLKMDIQKSNLSDEQLKELVDQHENAKQVFRENDLPNKKELNEQ